MPTKKVPAKKTAKKATKKATKTVAKKVAKKVIKKPVAKKTIKKTPTKKVTKKKAAPKKSKKDLVYSSDEQSFWTTNGQVLNSLLALSDAFDQMEKDVYEFHAGGGQNDFALWVDTVLCDGDCAAALAKAKNTKSARTVVVRHLKLYAV